MGYFFILNNPAKYPVGQGWHTINSSGPGFSYPGSSQYDSIWAAFPGTIQVLSAQYALENLDFTAEENTWEK